MSAMGHKQSFNSLSLDRLVSARSGRSHDSCSALLGGILVTRNSELFPDERLYFSSAGNLEDIGSLFNLVSILEFQSKRKKRTAQSF